VHRSLARARAALAVSGTVLIDLLHQRLPTVVVYRTPSALALRLYRGLVVAPWFASPNLLAGREVLPERAFSGRGPQAEVGDALARCYNDEAWRRRCLAGLELAARRLGPAGACDRAAAALLQLLQESPDRTAPPPEP
jgi:lipid-A-disaccharide synthase